MGIGLFSRRAGNVLSSPMFARIANLVSSDQPCLLACVLPAYASVFVSVRLRRRMGCHWRETAASRLFCGWLGTDST
jgi:hypothetical protein